MLPQVEQAQLMRKDQWAPVWSEPEPDKINVILWVAVAVAVIVAIGVITHLRWRSLRPRMFQKTPELLALEQPGLLATHLDPDRWLQTFQTVLTNARRSLAEDPSDLARETAGALDKALACAGDLAPAARAAAVQSLQTGTLQSLVVRAEEQLVYMLVFPGRHEHVGHFQRYEPFTGGWVNHVSRLRRQVADGKRADSLLCLLYFLSSNARDGVLLVAHEGAAGRVVPGELAPDGAANGERTLRLADKFDFQLA